MTKFSDEVVLHSQQRHPSIVQLMGVYYPPRSQLPMLIMEYLPFSLTQCLEKEELPLQLKYCILLDVAKGVCYLHGKHPPIVHRDLTANNVLLTSSYTAKISDLGVSRLADTFKKQQLTTAPGNAMVMPPEALVDKPVYDHKLDVFSYGCLIIHVLTGQFPEPTNQFVPGKIKIFYTKVSEWDRRVKYVQQIPKENGLLPLAKRCLNDFAGRPEMIECCKCVERVLLRYPKMKLSAIELNIENEARKKELQGLAKQNEVLQAKALASENEVETLKAEKEAMVKLIREEEACKERLSAQIKILQAEKGVLKVEKEEVAEKLKLKSKQAKNITSQVIGLQSLLLLRGKEFNDYTEVLKETIRSRDKQLVKTQHDNMTILKKREDELREEHSVALSKMKEEYEEKIFTTTEKFEQQLSKVYEEYEAKISKMKEEYEEKLSTATKMFEQDISKTHDNCEEEYEEKLSTTTIKFEQHFSKTHEEYEEEYEEKLSTTKKKFEQQLSKFCKEYEAKITKMKEEYKEKLSTATKKFEQQLSKTHEDCEVRVADVIKQFTVKSSEALENATKSKNETISFLLSQASVIIPSYKAQKVLIQPYLTQCLKKGDKW